VRISYPSVLVEKVWRECIGFDPLDVMFRKLDALQHRCTSENLPIFALIVAGRTFSTGLTALRSRSATVPFLALPRFTFFLKLIESQSLGLGA
jgi:hypothetical protein